MKKYLPILLFVLGLIAFGGIYFFVIRDKEEAPAFEEEVAEIPFEQRPFTSMTPVEAGECLPEGTTTNPGTASEQGHCLKMKIEKIVVDAATLDYELLYQDNTGRTLGVPGTINLTGDKTIERDLLLGSESSGKLRFDEGVEGGSLTLRFRNDKGKLIGKVTTDFHLQTDTDKLTSLDEKFAYGLSDSTEGVYFVTMETFGLPEGVDAPGNVASGPYGVFGSEEGFEGTVTMEGNANRLNGNEWEKLNDGASVDIGVFIGTSE